MGESIDQVAVRFVRRVVTKTGKGAVVGAGAGGLFAGPIGAAFGATTGAMVGFVAGWVREMDRVGGDQISKIASEIRSHYSDDQIKTADAETRRAASKSAAKSHKAPKPAKGRK